MRRIFCFIVLFMIGLSSAFAQNVDTLECDAKGRDTSEMQDLPYFGNNDYLENFLDSIGYPRPTSQNRIIGLNQVRYRIPIKFWVYRRSDGTGGPTFEHLANYIRDLNRFYNIENNTWIGFYMKCDIGYINDDRRLIIGDDKLFSGYDEGRDMIQENKEKGCINIHITNDLTGNTIGVHYRARFFGVDGIFLSSITYISGNLAATIAHEVGHYLELDHTHLHSDKGSCRKEAIDRNREWPFFTFCPLGGGRDLRSRKVCESTGDCLRDTPADHDLSFNNACTYETTGQTDPWGDHYETPPAGSQPPDPRNIMSYNRMRTCHDFFSRLQIAVMLHSIIRGKSKNNRPGWEALRTVYDEYEMDNFPLAARNINANEIQERNFHQQYNEDAWGNPVWTNCDVDWVRFVAQCSNTFDIETFYASGTISPNTRLTLFAADGVTQLAQNDDISATNKFSKITYSFTAGTAYLIRVENLNPVLVDYNSSFYNISIGGARITGVDEFCSGSTFTLEAPAGTNVTWSVSPDPSDIATYSVNGTSISLYQKPIGFSSRIANSGPITITANYNHPCTGAGVVSKTIFVGTKTPSYALYAPNGYCPGASFEVIGISNNTGTVTYDWYINGVLNSYHGSKLRGTFVNGYGTYIGLQVRKPGCGISQEYYQYLSCSGGGGVEVMSISPNPGSSDVRVETKGEITFERIRLIDKMGAVMQEWIVPSKSKTATINVSRFSSDIYTIQVFDGQQWLGALFKKQ